jgi:hypothetical protein
MSRIIFKAMRDAGRPMTSKEITFQVMAERSLNVADKRLVRKRIGACLKHYKHRGTLKATGAGSFLP